MIKKLFLFLFLSITLKASDITIYPSIEKTPVTKEESLKKIVEEISEKGLSLENPFVRCIETEELNTTYLCIFNNQKAMNVCMLRASIFSEMIDPAIKKDETRDLGAIIKALPDKIQLFEDEFSENPTKLSMLLNKVRGHDIKGSEINDFIHVVNYSDRRIATEFKYKEAESFYNMEVFFRKNFLEKLKENHPEGDYVLISIFVTPEIEVIASHEMLHAQYFLKEDFRKNVDEFVNTRVKKEDLDFFVKTMTELAYPQMPNDTYLRNNEFMAYTLGAGSIEDLKANPQKFPPELPKILVKYVKPMKRFLTQKGTAPIMLKI